TCGEDRCVRAGLDSNATAPRPIAAVPSSLVCAASCWDDRRFAPQKMPIVPARRGSEGVSSAAIIAAAPLPTPLFDMSALFSFTSDALRALADAALARARERGASDAAAEVSESV